MDFADRFPVSPILQWADAQNLDARGWLSVDRVDADYISHHALHRVYEQLVASGFDERVGLEIGSLCGLGSLGLYGQLLQHAATLAEAAELYMRHREIHVSPKTYVDVENEASRFTIFVSVPEGKAFRPSSNFRLAFAYAQTLYLFRDVFKDPTIRATAVHFQSEDDRYQAIYEEFFGGAALFAQDVCSIEFELELMSRPIPHSVPATRPFLEEMALMRLNQSRSLGLFPGDFIQELRNELRETLLVGPADVEAVARRVNISARTLHRRLAENGLSFRQLTDDVLKEMALQFLRNPDLTVQEIAFKLGYTQASSFTRAFKRWTGRSPNDVREDIVS